ncbi:MAG TPA: hypothetical protein VLE19_14615, partial [Pyrinomonadaceae bacterium]|nr:hypothetical protein [Pyrinomonadaceae bacterium]
MSSKSLDRIGGHHRLQPVEFQLHRYGKSTRRLETPQASSLWSFNFTATDQPTRRQRDTTGF